MSAIEKAGKVAGKPKSVDFAVSEGASTPPRFASHTQSSLMKKRTPINLRKKLSSTSVRESRRSSGILKRWSGSRHLQSRSVLALKKVLDQHHRATRSLSGCVLTETACRSKQYAENLLVSFRDNLINDVSRNIIKYTRSPIKLASRIVGRSEKRAEDPSKFSDVTCELSISSVSLQERLDSKSVCESSEDVASRSRHSEEDSIKKESAESCCEEDDTNISEFYVIKKHEENDREPQTLPDRETSSKTLQNDGIKVLHRRSRHRRLKETDSLNESNLETQVCQQTTTNRKYTQRIWKKRKTKVQNVGTDTDNAGSQSSANPKIVKQIDNTQDTDTRATARSARKKDGQRKFGFNDRRAWRPAGIGKYSNMENTESSTQLTSQKSSRPTEKPGAPARSKHSSVEQVEFFKSFDSESASAPMSANRSKENRDPRDRATKNCEQTAEAKEQQDQQRKGAQKRRRWARRVPNNPGKDNEGAGSRSIWQHWRSFTPRSPKDLNEQSYPESAKIYGRRSRPAEVIHALKEIIGSVSDDGEGNVAGASKTDVFRENDGETLPSRDASSSEVPLNDDPRRLATIESEATRSLEQPSWRTIDTQTELNYPSRPSVDPGTNLDTERISTETVATQTLPPRGENTAEIGCNTVRYGDICRDAEVSCDLISSSSVKTDATAIEEESTSGNNNATRATRSSPEENSTRIYDPDGAYDIIFDDESSYEDSNCYYEIGSSAPGVRNDAEERRTLDALAENMKTVFELAAEHARNLREAVVIYYENLMSREKRNEEIPDDETSRDYCRLVRRASFTSTASVDEAEPEHDGERLVTGDNDFDEFSICSSSSCSSEETVIETVIRDSRAEIDRAEGNENAIAARSSLNEPFDLENVRSMMRLLMRRAQEERALEILRTVGDDEESLETGDRVKTAEKPSIVSRENLLPLVYCVLCTLVLWCLPFSFRCHFHSDA